MTGTIEDICLINSPQPYLINPKSQTNLGLLYLYSSLKKLGYNAQYSNLSDARDIDDALKRLPDMEAYGFTATYVDYPLVEEFSKILRQHGKKTILGGPFATGCRELVDPLSFDSILLGEGEFELPNALQDNFNNKFYVGKTIRDLDTVPFPKHELDDIVGDFFAHGKKYSDGRSINLITSRGCPFNCLTGDTKINTVDGMVPIKDLAGREKVGVFTMNGEGEVFITDGIKCQKTRENADLVRIHFDDGSHIDCTPDHKIKTFKNGNQFVPKRSFVVEAKDLKPKMSVFALKSNLGGPTRTYEYVSWGRRKSCSLHRLIAEYKIGRQIRPTEVVHHLDNNSLNNSIDNITVIEKDAHHKIHRVARSKRMKENNAAKDMTLEQRQALGRMQKGKKRTLQSKINYRKSKLGINNPNYKDGKTAGTKSRIPFINHKVVRVEHLPHKEDVYDLEVPETHWFFANNVLVHNCSFCDSRKIWGKKPRYRSVENVLEEIDYYAKNFGVRNIRFNDDNVTDSKKRMYSLCEGISRISDKYGEMFWRVSTRVKPSSLELWKTMRDAGCVEISFGIESFDQEVLDVLNKRTTVEDNVKAIYDASASGIMPRLLLMVNTPGETLETIDRNIKNLQPLEDKCSVSCKPFIVAPGSDIWRRPEKYNIDILNKNFRETNLNYFHWIRNPDGEIVNNYNSPNHIIRGLSIDEMINNRERMFQYLNKSGLNAEK